MSWPAAVRTTQPLLEQRGWDARLQLRIARVGVRSTLVDCAHSGPLRVQKVLYPEGPDIAQVLLVHPPGGIAGGDTLDVRVDVHSGAHVLLTTPGAGKWYKSNGRVAYQQVALSVQAGGALEWLPQENIIFDQTVAEQHLRVDCAGAARACGWDITVLGRRASREQFRQGQLSQRLLLHRDGRLCWAERSRVSGDDPVLRSPVGWDGQHVCGLFWALGAPVDDGLLDTCRGVEEPRVQLGVTAPREGLLLARALSDSTERLRAAFTRIWACVRPRLFARPAIPPRIWMT